MVEAPPKSKWSPESYNGDNPRAKATATKYVSAMSVYKDKLEKYHEYRNRLAAYLDGYLGSGNYDSLALHSNMHSKGIRRDKIIEDIDGGYQGKVMGAFEKLDKLYEGGQDAYSEAQETKVRFHKVVGGEADPTFIAEGRKLRNFYKKHGVDAEVVPFYGDKREFLDSLKDINEEDEVVLMGHAGRKLGGISNKWLAKAISKRNPARCSIGSCSFEKYAEPYINAKFNSLVIRPKNSWLGVNPRAEDFLNAMYGINESDSGEAEVTQLDSTSYKEYK